MMFLSTCVANESKNMNHRVASHAIGEATFYTVKTNGGTTTASGIPLSDRKLTAASVMFPIGSMLRVTSMHTNKSVDVTITDRGPFATTNGQAIKPLRNHPTRIVDLSYAAAKVIGLHTKGVLKVKVQRIK